MFNNVGKKIQGIVAIIFVIEFIVSCIIGIFFGILVYNSSDSIGTAILVGLVITAIGSFFSWLSLLLLYAFGKIEESCAVQCELLKHLVTRQSGDSIVMYPANKKCPACNETIDNDSIFCSACGTKYTT